MLLSLGGSFASGADADESLVLLHFEHSFKEGSVQVEQVSGGDVDYSGPGAGSELLGEFTVSDFVSSPHIDDDGVFDASAVLEETVQKHGSVTVGHDVLEILNCDVDHVVEIREVVLLLGAFEVDHFL